MHDGNDEQLLCLLTFKYLAFIFKLFQELLNLKFNIYGSMNLKLKSR